MADSLNAWSSLLLCCILTPEVLALFVVVLFATEGYCFLGVDSEGYCEIIGSIYDVVEGDLRGEIAVDGTELLSLSGTEWEWSIDSSSSAFT